MRRILPMVFVSAFPSLMEGAYYSRESPGISLVYMQQAESVKKQLKAQFGNVLKQ